MPTDAQPPPDSAQSHAVVLRRYGEWAGNPKGFPENIAFCVEEVQASGTWPHYHQCNRKRGHGPDGLYCKQHAKKHAAE